MVHGACENKELFAFFLIQCGGKKGGQYRERRKGKATSLLPGEMTRFIYYVDERA